MQLQLSSLCPILLLYFSESKYKGHIIKTTCMLSLFFFYIPFLSFPFPSLSALLIYWCLHSALNFKFPIYVLPFIRIISFSYSSFFNRNSIFFFLYSLLFKILFPFIVFSSLTFFFLILFHFFVFQFFYCIKDIILKI